MPVGKVTLLPLKEYCAGKGYFPISDYDFPRGKVCGFPPVATRWVLELPAMSLRYMSELGEGDDGIDIRVSRIEYSEDGCTGVYARVYGSVVTSYVNKTDASRATLTKAITQLMRKSFKQEFTIKQIKADGL